MKVRTVGLGEKYICIIDTENYGYEWGLLSDIDHQENSGFIRYPQKITVLNQREFRNITAGPDFILSDTLLREDEMSTNEVSEGTNWRLPLKIRRFTKAPRPTT